MYPTDIFAYVSNDVFTMLFISELFIILLNGRILEMINNENTEYYIAMKRNEESFCVPRYGAITNF